MRKCRKYAIYQTIRKVKKIGQIAELLIIDRTIWLWNYSCRQSNFFLRNALNAAYLADNYLAFNDSTNKIFVKIRLLEN